MLNDIVNGISIKLNSIFGDNYEIYDENVEQGILEDATDEQGTEERKPCFFIKPLKVLSKPLLGKRKQMTYPFDIAYITDKGNEEMMDVSEKALNGLEYITLLNGDILRAISPEAEIVDGVLHISVIYIVFLNEHTVDDSMETFETDIGMKEG